MDDAKDRRIRTSNKKVLKDLVYNKNTNIEHIEIEFVVVDNNDITDLQRKSGFAYKKQSDHFKVTLLCRKKKAKIKKGKNK